MNVHKIKSCIWICPPVPGLDVGFRNAFHCDCCSAARIAVRKMHIVENVFFICFCVLCSTCNWFFELHFFHFQVLCCAILKTIPSAEFPKYSKLFSRQQPVSQLSQKPIHSFNCHVSGHNCLPFSS